MAWFKVDDQLPDHRKVRRLRGDKLAAMGLWTLCGAWSGRNLQDGYVPDDIVEDEDPDHLMAKRLVDVGLWERVLGPDENGYQFHEWGQANPMRSAVHAEREDKRIKTALYRDPELIKAVRERDANRCRFCGQQVRWSDRRSLHAAALMLLDPSDPLTSNNVVTACRGCTEKRAGRPLRVARMSVLPPMSTGTSTPAPEISLQGDPYLDTNQNGSRSEPENTQVQLSPRPDPTRPERVSTSRGPVPRSTNGDKRARKLGALAHSGRSFGLISKYAQECPGVVPTDVKAELGPFVDGLISDGLTDPEIAESLIEWGKRGMPASVLPSVALGVVNRMRATPAAPAGPVVDPDDPMTFDDRRLDKILGPDPTMHPPAGISHEDLKRWRVEAPAARLQERRLKVKAMMEERAAR